LVAVGSGLLKSNISALVGKLYPEGGARRDAGFTIFYMGINIGAALGPLVCSYLGEQVNWHYGFGAAAIGMFFGLTQFRLTKHRLGGHGAEPETALSPRARWPLVMSAGVIAGMIVLMFTGVIRINPVVLARYSTTLILTVAVLFFGAAFLLGNLNRVEKQRIAVIVVLFFASALFWAGFEQVGSSLNLFAERHTERVISSIGFTIPAGWFQSLGAVFIVVFAPVFANLWVRLAQRNLNPSAPAKFGFGLVLLALGFVIMAGAAAALAGGGKASALWLTTTYLLHTFGELCLSPVGLSTVSKLAPPRLVGQMMGSWFLATSLGNILAGLIAGDVISEDRAGMARQFLNITWLPLCAGVLLVLLAPRIKRWMHGAE
jgi:proton-dependent oligopeptide transporter, POT family